MNSNSITLQTNNIKLPKASSKLPQFARSLPPQGEQDILVRNIQFGATDETKTNVLPSSEEVMEPDELSKAIENAPFYSGFYLGEQFAQFVPNKEIQVSPFTLGLLSNFYDALMFMPKVEKVEQDAQVPIEQVQFRNPQEGQPFLRAKDIATKAANSLLGKDLSQLKHTVISEVLNKHLTPWHAFNQVLIENGGINPENPETQDPSLTASSSDSQNTFKNKVKNYFLLSNPIPKNPLTHILLGLLPGLIIPPLPLITVPLALVLGFSFTSSNPNKEETTFLSEESNVPTGESYLSTPLTQLLTAYAQQNKTTEQDFKGYFDLLKQCSDNPKGIPHEILETANRVQEIKAELKKLIESGEATADLEKDSPEYYEKQLSELYDIDQPKISDERHEDLNRLISRLKKQAPMSAETAMLKEQIELILKLPTERKTLKDYNRNEAKIILDSEHYGLEKVKTQVLDHLGAEHFVKDLPIDKKDKLSTVLCLLGPPGIGKTSIGHSIANATGRDFEKVSLGGTNMESDIRGHSKTFINSDAGRIIKSLVKAGSINPVILLDEIDKLDHSQNNGNPAAALLEVLDSDNTGFKDKFVDTPVDLSNVMFVCTANDRSQIDPTLADRMEFIELPGYISEDKIEIANRHLIPKTRRRYGLNQLSLSQKGLIDESSNFTEGEEPFSFSPSALKDLISGGYSAGLGIRSLEKVINKIGRTLASQLTAKENAGETLNSEDFSFLESIEALKEQQFIGRAPSPINQVSPNGQIGIMNGLFYSAGGIRSGGTLPITVDVIRSEKSKNKKKLELGVINIKPEASTQEELDEGRFKRGDIMGNLQGSMKESILVATDYVENIWETLEPFVAPQYKDSDLKLNFYVKDLAVPKDGPSATAAITIAIISALTRTAIPGDFAMTGEMSLRGEIMPIGGVREKVAGAREEGVKHIIIPSENEEEYQEDIPAVIQNEIVHQNVEHITDVMEELWGKDKADMITALKEKYQNDIVEVSSKTKVKFSGKAVSQSPFLKIASKF